MKKKKTLTEAEQLEVDLQLESELARLQRQQRILERDRGSYSTGPKLVKQRKLLGILQKEKNNIQTDLFVATCSTKKTQDANVNADLQSLISEHDTFEGQIKEKKAHLEEIDYQVEQVKKEVIEMRAKVPTDTQHQDRVLAGQKSVEALENKLETAIKRFCAISTENRQLREEINHLLLERISFNKIWGNLIDNLNKGKAFMMDLIEQASIAYNQREEWCTKLQALRNRGHSDLVLHTQEMQQLQRKIDHDGKLEDFFITKGRKRVMRDLEERETIKREQQREKMQSLLQTHKQILAQIIEFTNAPDVTAVESVYLKNETENFAMLGYINDLHAEIENLTGSLVEMHVEIDKEKEIRAQRAEHQKDNIEKLKEQLKQTTIEADNSLAGLNLTNQQLGKLYDGINKLCEICKCSYQYNTFFELLGENVQVNDYNVLLYLGLLEKTVTRYMLDVYYKEKTAPKKARGDFAVINDGQIALPVREIHSIVPSNPCPLCVEQEQVSDVIDTLQFVQTRDEVEGKLAQRLKLPDGLDRLHNVSACHLPKSRQIIQKRYQ